MHDNFYVLLFILFVAALVCFCTQALSDQIKDGVLALSHQIQKKGDQIMSNTNLAAQGLEAAITRLEIDLAIEQKKNQAVRNLISQLVAQTAQNGSLNEDQIRAFAARVNTAADLVESESAADDNVTPKTPEVAPAPASTPVSAPEPTPAQ
jgi:hypothetical protein